MTRGRLPKRPGTDRFVYQSNTIDWDPVHRAAAVTVPGHPSLGAEMWRRTFLYGLCTRGASMLNPRPGPYCEDGSFCGCLETVIEEGRIATTSVGLSRR
jgi:hypothetical protein